MSEIRANISQNDIQTLCDTIRKYNQIEPGNYDRFNVKRGLRNADGTGVMAGVTRVCSVDGYYIEDGELIPREGKLYYRGISLSDIVAGCNAEDRFGFEEVAWLLLFGTLPTQEQLEFFCTLLGRNRELPDDFIEDMIMKAPSPDIMNKLSRSILSLYSYDPNPDDISLENVLRQSISLMAKMPVIMAYAYQVKRRHYYHKSMYIHQIKPEFHTAETILRSIRADKSFSDREAKLLDTCLMIQAEHGGGNNSTFATRVLSSSGTDTYSAIAAGIGALKGPRHGGANKKVCDMVEAIKADVQDMTDAGQVADALVRVMRREIGDGSGLIYGMGHAVYTLSDPRATILRAKAEEFAVGTEFEPEYRLLRNIEQMTPEVFAAEKGIRKPICANVDLYSGLIYKMLRIPNDLFTPIFTAARVAGWSAHRIEELLTCNKIIRPAYKSVNGHQGYIPIQDR
ncbi:MAG: citrate synthase [Clostridia bacterium]|nr:citrate synthase [Clostridia bacterium]